MNKGEKIFANDAGWYGAVAILVAYALMSFGVLAATHWLYQLLNLTSASGITIETWRRKDWQPAVLNLVWTLIALLALIRIIGPR